MPFVRIFVKTDPAVCLFACLSCLPICVFVFVYLCVCFLSVCMFLCLSVLSRLSKLTDQPPAPTFCCHSSNHSLCSLNQSFDSETNSNGVSWDDLMIWGKQRYFGALEREGWTLQKHSTFWHCQDLIFIITLFFVGVCLL